MNIATKVTKVTITATIVRKDGKREELGKIVEKVIGGAGNR